MDNNERPFLRHFDANERGWINNLFLDAVRKDGMTTPGDVVNRVSWRVHERIDREYRDSGNPMWNKLMAIKRALAQHLDEADELAAQALAYEALSPEERAAHKEAEAAAGRRRFMEAQPATTAQLNYLRALGYDGPVENKAHASDLIAEYKRGQHGTAA